MSGSDLRGCPEPGELARALSLGVAADTDLGLYRHLAGCIRCRTAWNQQQEVVALGRQLPFERPGPERLRRVRTTILAAADRERRVRPRRRLAFIAGAAIAAAAIVTLVVGALGPQRSDLSDSAELQSLVRPASPATAAPRSPAHIRSGAGTRFKVLAGPPHEKVELQQGSLLVTVEPAVRGETFLIVTRRGEVEVRGTIFEAVASVEGLSSVRVDRGKVAVRPVPGQELILAAGQQWQRTASVPSTASPRHRTRRGPLAGAVPGEPRRVPLTAAEAQTSSWGTDDFIPGGTPGPAGDPPAPSAAVSPAPAGARVAPAPADPANLAFGQGLNLLRAGQASAAAAAFDRAAALEPSSGLVEDVWYWRAVALTQAGGGPKARRALSEFIVRFPLSARAGEASVILGRLLHDAGDLAQAAARFRAGLHDRSARVRQAAEAGLKATEAAGGSVGR